MIEYNKLKKMKLLVGCPTSEVKSYCEDLYLSTITNLFYPKELYDILIVDNSPTGKNAKRINKLGINCRHVNPKGKTNQQYIAESQEVLRKYALDNDYDYLVMIESDIIPPLTCLTSLLSHQLPVVCGLYFIGHGADSYPMRQLVEKDGNQERYTINSDGMHSINDIDGQLKEVQNGGFGCIAIHRSVLSQIQFRSEKGADSHSDSYFGADLAQLGIKQHQDTSLMCEHLNGNWNTVLDAYIVPENLKK
jgi:hypothetical protein